MGSITQLVIATRNRGKLGEIQHLLRECPIKVLSLSDVTGRDIPADVEEIGRTFGENAENKAIEYAVACDQIVVACNVGTGVADVPENSA